MSTSTKLPTPPNPASVSTDGDIHELYASYICDYIAGPGTASELRGFPLVDQFQQGGDLSWWDSFCQTVKSVWTGTESLFESATETVTHYQEAKDDIEQLFNDAKALWDNFVEGRDDLDEPNEDGRKRSGMVVTVRQAIEAIERFRLGHLKQTISEQWQKIEDQLTLIKTGGQTLVNGAAAYAGRPSVGGLVTAGAALNQIQLASLYVKDVCAALLEIVKLFDLITDIEDDLEKQSLQQVNPRHARKFKGVTRSPLSD